jgi:AcrR family transcriptional regulator
MTMHARLNRRSERTRTQLMSAFTKLVFAKGFENVSVRELVAEAGVVRSTFYEHFSDKEDVLRSCMTRFFAVVADCACADSMPRELNRVLDHLWSNRRLTDGIFTGHARAILARNQADLVETRLRSIGPNAALPSRLAAIEIAEAQLALIESWMRGRAFCSTEKLATGLHRSSRALALSVTA